MTVPGVQSALSVKNAGVEMLAESDKTQAVSGSDQFGAVCRKGNNRAFRRDGQSRRLLQAVLGICFAVIRFGPCTT